MRERKGAHCRLEPGTHISSKAPSTTTNHCTIDTSNSDLLIISEEPTSPAWAQRLKVSKKMHPNGGWISTFATYTHTLTLFACIHRQIHPPLDPNSFIWAATNLLSPQHLAMFSICRLRPSKISAQLRQINTDFQICRTSMALRKRLPEWLALFTEIFAGGSAYSLPLSPSCTLSFRMLNFPLCNDDYLLSKWSLR